MSFFCDSCGSLKQRRAVRGQSVAVCPNCDADGTPSGAPTTGKAWRAQDTPRGAARSFGATVAAPRSRRAERDPSAPKPAQERRAPKELPAPAALDLPPDADLFPHATVREGQRQFIADVAEAAENRSILVANAPTGLGKTVSSLAPLVKYAIGHKKRVFFLTSKQSQHKIAIDTLRAIRGKAGVPFVVSDIIGKQDMCPRREARELFPKRFAEFCRRQMVNRECDYFENDNKGAIRRLRDKIHHVEETVILSTDCVVCPHQTALDLAAQAHVTVCDYNYFFSDMREGMQERLKVDLSDVLLVVDEGHNLPDRIRDHLSLELNDFVIDDAIDELKDLGEGHLPRLIEGLRDVVATLGDEPVEDDPDEGRSRAGSLFSFGEDGAPSSRTPTSRRGASGRDGERHVSRGELVERVNAHLEKGVASLTVSDYDSVLSDLTVACDEYEGKFKEEPRGLALLRDFLVNWKRERAGLVRVFKRDPAPTLVYRMLDPAIIARNVFESVHAAVVMSGTLHPGEMYRDVLGLPADRTVVRHYRSPFPPENRLVLADDSVTTSYQERSDAMSERIAVNLAAVAEATPGNVAAFFPSYAILESVRRHLPEYLKRKDLIVEERGTTKAEKEGLVGQMRRGAEDALLCGVQGGSLSEGYDYEDNLLKGIVIVGLPFAAPSLEVQALIDYYERKFGKAVGRNYAYVYPTMNRVLQAAGRSIRGPDDRGVIVLMDKRFNWSSYRSTFPRDFQPRLARDLQRDVRAFWGAR